MEEHLTTLEPSPLDNRDWIYDKTLTNTPLPTTFNYLNILLPVRNQGPRGTCAAFTAACIKEVQEKREHAEFTGYFSPDSIYFHRENKPSAGMYARDLMKILSVYGAAREAFLPYSNIEPKSLNKQTVEDAFNFRISGYARVNSIEAAKTAIYNNGPLLGAFPYFSNGTNYFWRANGRMTGGHAVAVVGWDNTGFLLRNSYGPSWNGNGYIIWPYTDFSMAWELWSTVDATTIFPSILPSTPVVPTPVVPTPVVPTPVVPTPVVPTPVVPTPVVPRPIVVRPIVVRLTPRPTRNNIRRR
jgi:Papain family cysteine protease